MLTLVDSAISVLLLPNYYYEEKKSLCLIDHFFKVIVYDNHSKWVNEDMTCRVSLRSSGLRCIVKYYSPLLSTGPLTQTTSHSTGWMYGCMDDCLHTHTHRLLKLQWDARTYCICVRCMPLICPIFIIISLLISRLLGTDTIFGGDGALYVWGWGFFKCVVANTLSLCTSFNILTEKQRWTTLWGLRPLLWAWLPPVGPTATQCGWGCS